MISEEHLGEHVAHIVAHAEVRRDHFVVPHRPKQQAAVFEMCSHHAAKVRLDGAHRRGMACQLFGEEGGEVCVNV